MVRNRRIRYHRSMYYLGSFDDVVHRYSNTGRHQFEEMQQCLFSMCLMSPGRWILNDGFLLHSEAGRDAIMGLNGSLLMDVIGGGLIRLEQRNPDIKEMVRKMADRGITSYQEFGRFLDTAGGRQALDLMEAAKSAVKPFDWGRWDADSAFLALAEHALLELEADGMAAGYHLLVLDELKTTLVEFLKIARQRRRSGPPFGARDLFERVALEVATGRPTLGTADNSPSVLAALRSGSTYEWARLRMMMRVANEIYHTAHALCHATKEIKHKRQVQPGFGALTYCSPLFHSLHANHRKDIPFGGADDLLNSLKVPSLPLKALRDPANRERLLMFAAEDRGSEYAVARKQWANEFFKALSTDDDGQRGKLFEKSISFEERTRVLIDHDEVERPIRVVKPEAFKFVIEEGFSFVGNYGGLAGGAIGAVAGAAIGVPEVQSYAQLIGGAAGIVVGTFTGKVAARYASARNKQLERRRAKEKFFSDVKKLVQMHEFVRFGLMQLSPNACLPIAAKLEKWTPR